MCEDKIKNEQRKVLTRFISLQDDESLHYIFVDISESNAKLRTYLERLTFLHKLTAE